MTNPEAIVALPDELRGVLIAAGSERLLLPNSCIAEIISYSEPEPIAGTPGWLLGSTRWRGWKVPVLSPQLMLGLPAAKTSIGVKIVVLKALAGTVGMSYFALLSQGFPRLTRVASHELRLVEGLKGQLPGFHSRVQLGEDLALIPDLFAIEALIVAALATTSNPVTVHGL